jgi:hypothetical protein
MALALNSKVARLRRRCHDTYCIDGVSSRGRDMDVIHATAPQPNRAVQGEASGWRPARRRYVRRPESHCARLRNASGSVISMTA